MDEGRATKKREEVACRIIVFKPSARAGRKKGWSVGVAETGMFNVASQCGLSPELKEGVSGAISGVHGLGLSVAP